MAQYSIVEEPRPVQSRSNHPCHQHDLIKTDMRERYQSLWRCDLCRLEFNSKKSLQTAYEDEEPDPTFAYHCEQCSFDVCTSCFKGYLHPFHHHRLKKALVSLIYPETEGNWRCDACHKVFTQETAPTSHHCPQCEVDICDKCFTGSWKHVLHTLYHSLKPVDPRLTYRKYTSWFCDVCGREFTSRDTETFFNCSICQYDICSECFRGNKHHLHQHPLCLVSKETHGGSSCSNCSKYIVESQYRKCKDPNCSFSLCGLCYLSPPKYHPYHRDHPLAMCDADVVYPQSAGLWHCDYCTSMNPYGEQVALPASQQMYHCEVCDYDLCESCYKRGLEELMQQESSSSFSTRRIQHDSNISGYYNNIMDTNQDTKGTGLYPYSTIVTPPSMHSAGGDLRTIHHSISNPFRPILSSHNSYYSNGMESLQVNPSGFGMSSSKQLGSAPPSVNSYYYSGGGEASRPLGASLRHGSSMYGESSKDGSWCMVCKARKATKYFCHGKSVMTCTAKAVVCDQCAGEIVMASKPCPACGRIPDGVSSISF